MSARIRMLVVPFIAAAAGCAPSERAADLAPRDPVRALAARDSAARTLVIRWMARRDRSLIGGKDRVFDPRNVVLAADSSRAVPGLVYRWGFYAPPGTADAWVEIAAARGPAEARLLESPEDWAAAARAAGWRPTTAEATLGGCIEAVQTTGPRSSLRWRPFAYLEPASLPAELRQSGRLFTPRVEGDSASGFRVAFWMVEARRIARYDCAAASARFSLAATDSLPYMGIFPPGP